MDGEHGISGAVEGQGHNVSSELLPLVYEELRHLAANKLAHEAPGQTLQATALVHEAWLRLAGTSRWNNRQHFFRAAAQAMHRILVDRARQRRAERHGGGLQETEWTESKAPACAPDEELLAVHEALERLGQRDPVSAELVNLRYYAGLSMPEAAEALGIPLRNAERLWTFARAWLRKEIGSDLSQEIGSQLPKK
jgi:RNA polymerase sigma factor (TIGR02999 family)